MPLYAGLPPGSIAAPDAEITGANNVHSKVSVPTLTVYLPEKEKATGAAVVICPGGGYGVLVMEKEHDEAGELMAAIHQLTNGYQPPADACNTFRLSLAELKEFEEDLHRHVHLENHILFPMAATFCSEF